MAIHDLMLSQRATPRLAAFERIAVGVEGTASPTPADARIHLGWAAFKSRNLASDRR
jgi:hypothetical protein